MGCRFWRRECEGLEHLLRSTGKVGVVTLWCGMKPHGHVPEGDAPLLSLGRKPDRSVYGILILWTFEKFMAEGHECVE